MENQQFTKSTQSCYQPPIGKAWKCFYEKRINLSVKMIKKLKKWDNLGFSTTFLAMKNTVSYMIVTAEKGLKVIEKNSQIYSGVHFQGKIPITNLLYIDSLDCYLMFRQSKIYRKNINKRPPFPFFELSKSPLVTYGRVLYSKFNKKILFYANETRKALLVVGLERKQKEVDFSLPVQGRMSGLKLFGEKQNRLIWLGINGGVYISTINFELRKICSFGKTQLEKRDHESLSSVVVCSKQKFAFLYVESRMRPMPGKVVVLRIFMNRVEFRTAIETKFDNFSTQFGEYFAGHALLLGFSTHKMSIFLYDYDPGSDQLRELEAKRVSYTEHSLTEILKVRNKFYFIGSGRKVMEGSFQF